MPEYYGLIVNPEKVDRTGGESMSAIAEWIGEPEYPAATAALEAIANHMEIPHARK